MHPTDVRFVLHMRTARAQRRMLFGGKPALGRARLIWMLRKNGYRQEEGEGAVSTVGLKHRL